MAYATRDDVFLLALSAQAFVARARPVVSRDAGSAAVDIATGTIRIRGLGLTAADLVTFEATSGGTLPPELSAFITYTPVPIGGDLYRVAPLNGSTITSFTNVGAGWGIAVDQMRRLDAHLQDAAARIDECLTAETPPIKPDPLTGRYPPVLVGLNARMAARSAVVTMQFEDAAFKVAVDRLFALSAADGDTNPPAQPGSLLGDWKMGKPINPRPVDQTTVADNAARAGYGRPSAGWGTGIF